MEAALLQGALVANWIVEKFLSLTTRASCSLMAFAANDCQVSGKALEASSFVDLCVLVLGNLVVLG